MTAANASETVLANRVREDRRGPQAVVSRYSIFGGRRRGARRGGENVGYIADQHGVTLFVAVAAVVVLNILDAFYTMLFLSHGGVEMNPFVDWVLRTGGVWLFLIVKSLGIGLCVGFLTLTKNFVASRIGLGVVLVGYSALLCWHWYLLAFIPH